MKLARNGMDNHQPLRKEPIERNQKHKSVSQTKSPIQDIYVLNWAKNKHNQSLSLCRLNLLLEQNDEKGFF